jgi:hypothetical protein
MKNLLRIALLLVSCGVLLGQLPTTPLNNPNGTWESSSGTRYNLRLSGENIEVRLVEGSNPTYLQFELTLARTKEEVNTYVGKGFFRAKLKSGKECRFDTEWTIVVIGERNIVGNAPRYIEPDPATCTPKEKVMDRLELSKK